MAAEQRAELTRLSNAHMEAQNRQRMAESALVGLRDVALEHRNFIGELAARQGVTTNNIDARRTTTNNNYSTQTTDINVHSQVMNLLHTHSSQFGAYMQQRQLSDEQMQRLLYEHLRRGPPLSPQPFVIHMTQPPPPPPGAAGAVVRAITDAAAQPLPAPAPIPAPTIPAATPPALPYRE